MSPLAWTSLWLAIGAILGVWLTAREQKVMTLGDFIPSAIFGACFGLLLIFPLLYSYKDVVLWRRK